jgi:hypothetical protein
MKEIQRKRKRKKGTKRRRKEMRRRKGRRRNTTKKRTRRKRSLECHKTRRYRRRYRSASKKGPNSELSKVGRAQEGASATERGPAGGGGGGCRRIFPPEWQGKTKKGKRVCIPPRISALSGYTVPLLRERGRASGSCQARPGGTSATLYSHRWCGHWIATPLSLPKRTVSNVCGGGGGCAAWPLPKKTLRIDFTRT